MREEVMTMTMRIDVEHEIGWRERRADLLERQATEREDSAAMDFGMRSSYYHRAFDTAETYRTEARQLRDQASQLRAAAG